MKRLPDAAVQTRFNAAAKEELAISVVTLFELRFGAARAPYPAKLWPRIEERILSRCTVSRCARTMRCPPPIFFQRSLVTAGCA